MCTEISHKIKCQRGDCKHAKCKPDEQPCKNCTCNQMSEGEGRSFRYEMKEGKHDKHS